MVTPRCKMTAVNPNGAIAFATVDPFLIKFVRFVNETWHSTIIGTDRNPVKMSVLQLIAKSSAYHALAIFAKSVEAPALKIKERLWSSCRHQALSGLG